MPTVKTELEWPYRPADFFETQYRWQTDEYTLVADAGVVLVTLTVPSDPIDPGLQNEIAKKVIGLFLARQLLLHRTFELEPVRVYQHRDDGKKSTSFTAESVLLLSAVGQGDIVVRDASGAVVRDTKSERITEHTQFINLIIGKLDSSRQRNHSHNVSASSSLAWAGRSLGDGGMASTHGVPNQESKINCASLIAFDSPYQRRPNGSGDQAA